MAQGTNQKRQVAYKVRIADLINGRYVKKEGEWEPSFIETPIGLQVSRANIMGAVVSDPVLESGFGTLVLDDGTGSISIRVFQDTGLISNIRIGDAVLIIGRPREFSGQAYIVPEIIKKITDRRWMDYRKAELGILQKLYKEDTSGTAKTHEMGVYKAPGETINQPAQEKERPDKTESHEEEKSENYFDMITGIIKKNDDGGGADFDVVIEEAEKENIEDPEKLITSLLSEGEIFELRPGKIKVLE